MTTLATVIARGATGAQPDAATVGAGALFYDTTLNKLQRSTGAAWEDCEYVLADHDHTGDAGDGGKINLLLTPAPAGDTTVSGIIAPFTAHENVAFGDVCYVNADGEMAKADADAAASSLVVAMAAAAINADASGSFLLLGIARNDAWNWTVGGTLYLDTTTAGGMTQTAPSGTDDVVIVLGVATHADRVLFRPSGVMVEHT